MLENRAQIDLMRRTKQEHESELSHILRQNKSEAARDMARLRLVERIVQEKDHELMEATQHAGLAQMERDVLKEELVSLKSSRTISVEASGGEGAGSGGESSSPSVASMTRVNCLSVVCSSCLYLFMLVCLSVCLCTGCT